MTPRDTAFPEADQSPIDSKALERAVDECLSLVVITTTCADTCLPDESTPAPWVRSCLDCARRCTEAATLALSERIELAQEAGRTSILLLIRRGADPRFVALDISEEE